MADGLLKDLLEGKKYPTDLLIVIIWTVLAIIGVLVIPDGNVARIILGIPLLLFLPGYAFVSLLWPEKSVNKKVKDSEIEGKDGSGFDRAIENLERIALSFGLSIVILIILGLVLGYSRNLTFLPITGSLFVVIIVFGSIAWYRRIQVPKEERFNLSLLKERTKISNEWTLVDKGITASILVAIVFTASVFMYIVTTPIEGERFSEFYCVDENYTVENLPKDILINESKTIMIGVSNHEYSIVNYKIEISLLNLTGAIQNATLSTYNLTLDHDEEDIRPFTFEIERIGDYELLIELYKDGIDIPYCNIHIWLNVEQRIKLL